MEHKTANGGCGSSQYPVLQCIQLFAHGLQARACIVF